jgi:putative ABC transport system ATP-binding protein
MALVELSQIKKDYGSGDITVHALRGIDLSLEKGAFVAVAGPSGSGKSTLLNIMSGLDQATSGICRINGNELGEMNATQLSQLRLQKIGFIFQAYNLLPVLTAYENAEYVMMLQGVPENVRRDKTMAMLKRVGLEGMEHRFPRELSGGQQQRVAVARAIVGEPAIVLADEPTANLDSTTGGALMDLMAELNSEKGTTFIFSTHDKNVMDRSHEVIRLRDGVIDQESESRAVN